VVSATNPSDRNFDFLDLEPLQTVSKLYIIRSTEDQQGTSNEMFFIVPTLRYCLKISLPIHGCELWRIIRAVDKVSLNKKRSELLGSSLTISSH
jgi:hypothetical protein